MKVESLIFQPLYNFVISIIHIIFDEYYKVIFDQNMLLFERKSMSCKQETYQCINSRINRGRDIEEGYAPTICPILCERCAFSNWIIDISQL